MKGEEIDHNFKFHPPIGKAEIPHRSVRRSAKQLAEEIQKNVPEGREKSIALTKCEEAMMWACAGISRHSNPPVQIMANGKCNCSTLDVCPLKNNLSPERCTQEELNAAGVATVQMQPIKIS